jgi:sortase B
MSKKQKILIAGAALCAALFLFSGVMLAWQYADGKQSADAFETLAGLVQPDNAPRPGTSSGVTEGNVENFDPSLAAFEKYAAVYEQNTDFVGWISIDGTSINYPVMQTIDSPNFYLKRGFEKQYSNYGVPYVQENCALGISDNIVIYGHHMNNGSMFADLCKYESESFYQEHTTIRFDTLSSLGEYEIVAVFKTVAYAESGFKYYHFVDAAGEDDFNAFVGQCKALALYDTGVGAEYGDKLLTLSTCEYSRTNGRMVVVAKLITPEAGNA